VGFGDEIMVTARVRVLHTRNPVPVLIQGVDGKPRWSEVWEHNPRIARTAEEAGQTLRDGPGARPYLDYARLTQTRTFFRPQSLEPGEIYLTETERSFGRRIVLIEPHVKKGANSNRDWGFERFQSVVGACPDLPWAQCYYGGARILEGVEPIKADTFREVCAVMSGALAAVLPEGGLHHAAAAFGVKAVVIFGAYIPPSVTGYPDHINLARSVPEVEGLGPPDPRAQAALASITVAEVVEKLAEILGETSFGQGLKKLFLGRLVLLLKELLADVLREPASLRRLRWHRPTVNIAPGSNQKTTRANKEYSVHRPAVAQHHGPGCRRMGAADRRNRRRWRSAHNPSR
jgi:hypothetical protein